MPVDLLTRLTTTQALTDGVTIAWDAALGHTGVLMLGGNRTLANPANLIDGSYVLHVAQDVVGGRTLTYGSAYRWSGGVAPVLSVGASALDIITFVCRSGVMYGALLPTFADTPTGQGGLLDHDDLGGLTDDDHPQYLTTARGDARYYTEAETDTLLAGRASDAELAAHVALALVSAHGGRPPLELALCFVEDGAIEFVAPSARSYTAVIERGTGTIAYARALSAAPTMFDADTLPLDLAAGDVLRVTCAGRNGYKVLALTGALV